MKRIGIIAVVVAQVAFLLAMATEREWVARTGQLIALRTAPLDPNDPMRGQYSRLDYEIARVPWPLCQDAIKGWPRLDSGYFAGEVRDRKVYASLRVNASGIAEITALSDLKPSDGLFIRGRVQTTTERHVVVRYGVEALFMEQGKAAALDQERLSTKPGVPLNAQVALSRSGLAVLRDYKWEPLGITLTFENTARANPDSAQSATANGTLRTGSRVTAVKIKLKNYGPGDVTVADLPNGRSFRLLVDDRWQNPDFRWVGDDLAAPAISSEHLFVLKPGEAHETRIDLLQPEWFIVSTRRANENPAPVPLREVENVWSTMFRIEYLPPTADQVAGLPGAATLRSAPLRSRAFNAAAGAD